MKLNKNLRLILLSIIIIVFISGFVKFMPEYSFADNSMKIIVGDDINYPPYSFLDEKGRPTGFNVELAKAAGAAMGYDVEIRLDEWSKTRSALEQGEIDAISGMFYSEERENIYSFSAKHSITNGDIFTRKEIVINGIEDLRDKKIVVQKGDIIAEFLLNQNMNITLIEVPTVAEALTLIENKTYDYAGILKLPGIYNVRKNSFKNIKEQGIILNPNDYCMAVKKENENLLLILNGGMQIIKATGEYQEIYDKWLGVYEKKDFITHIKENLWVFLLFLWIVLGLLILSSILKHLVNQKTKELAETIEKIKYLSYHDHMTGLYNRRFFEEELKRLDIKSNLPLYIIIGDVNGLKLINDSFGHLMGDKLLIQVAEVLKKACTSNEIISRIGGDEFVILISKSSHSHAENLISTIKEISKKEKIGSINISISFGWDVKKNENEDIQEVFNRAEDYMYKKKLFDSPSVRGKTIGAILNALHEKNKREEQHSKRVSDLCKRLANALNFSDQQLEEVKTAGLLHDIGKIAINEDILNSLNILSEEEYLEMKRHSEVGYRILSAINDMGEIADYVLYHHERWDGKGYPTGLRAEEIPLQSRMISIADTYDAITSDRSYRIAKSRQYAINELKLNRSKQFDPNLVDLFIKEVVLAEEYNT
ncbi:HD domain-containing phosphohydrolase [Anaerovorax sp. IOR16]|uniref:HD domain-containing phosphohydrolase n=1 Tax=Anaerovorax sp. IOR16 TaxID=2773458 RepID=UPI0019D1FCE2|nr:transporter substrate-binding domain-containing protein [Anaerovorax sp. IOR16]